MSDRDTQDEPLFLVVRHQTTSRPARSSRVAAAEHPQVTPNVGSPCGGADLGNTATANDARRFVASPVTRAKLSWFINTGAVDTIAGLQAQGYTVAMDKVGDNPLETCIVTAVHREDDHHESRVGRHCPRWGLIARR